jgi:hypothetical protein
VPDTMIGVPPQPGDEAMITGTDAPDGTFGWLHVTSIRVRGVKDWATLIGTWPGRAQPVQIIVHLNTLPVRRKPHFSASLMSRQGTS